MSAFETPSSFSIASKSSSCSYPVDDVVSIGKLLHGDTGPLSEWDRGRREDQVQH
jgi:hypothetical protein